MSDSGKVTVSKGMLIGLAGTAICGLVAVAFLLGRLSGRNAPPSLSPGATPAVSSSETRPAPTTAPPVPAPHEFTQINGPEFVQPTRPGNASGVPAESGSVVELGPTVATVPPPPGSPPASRGDESAATTRAEVARYLDAVDNIGAGKVGEGEGVANEMAAALVRGDTSGLDRMIRDTESARAKLVALVPPAVCVTHHRESLGSIDDALEMLGALKTAMLSTDPATQLASVAGRATDLRTRAEAVQREEQSLRQRYDLKR